MPTIFKHAGRIKIGDLIEASASGCIDIERDHYRGIVVKRINCESKVIENCDSEHAGTSKCTRYFLYVKRDDGKSGWGDDNTWIVGEGVCRLIARAEEV